MLRLTLGVDLVANRADTRRIAHANGGDSAAGDRDESWWRDGAERVVARHDARVADQQVDSSVRHGSGAGEKLGTRGDEGGLRVCVECGMPIADHKEWCSILRGQQEMQRNSSESASRLQ